MSVKQHIPWQVRIAVKLVLARLPLDYEVFKKAGFFNLGEMESPDYALAVCRQHFGAANLCGRTDFTALELGPGDSLVSALIARAYGARRTYLVDVGPFASKNLGPYRTLAGRLRELGLRPPDVEVCSTFADLQAACGMQYLTEGLVSLRSIPTGSVDFVWSHAVLAHVRLEELLPTLVELRRIQRPGGVGSHYTGFGDVLGGGLNDLRFSERVWESPFMANSGFYTNRVQYQELMRFFEIAGFGPEIIRLSRRTTLPIPRRKMSAPFAELPEEHLRVCGLQVLLR